MNDVGSYTLLDAGEERKLERIGPYLAIRQAAQAHWPHNPDEKRWNEAQAVYHRSSSGGGKWEFKVTLPETWSVRFGPFRFLIKMTGFGHIGLFPEQLDNWDWLTRQGEPDLKVLNLFGYTGGSTLASARAGCSVTHVDASRGAVSWARENAADNNLKDAPIRWVVEDVQKYVAREKRRGSFYQGLILDPPSFGRGTTGQVWKIEKDLIPLLEALREIINPLRFVLLSCHTPGYGPGCLKNILNLVYGLEPGAIESGEMSVPVQNTPLVLPSGTYARWSVP